MKSLSTNEESIYNDLLYLIITIFKVIVGYRKYNMGTVMEISFQLLQQHNPWWFREEMILDDEKIREYERVSYPYIPPILAGYPEGTDAILTLRGPRQIGKSAMKNQNKKQTFFY